MIIVAARALNQDFLSADVLVPLMVTGRMDILRSVAILKAPFLNGFFFVAGCVCLREKQTPMCIDNFDLAA
jgi:hypothetical protein